jgi:NADH-quinone oxidoreductase subunit J
MSALFVMLDAFFLAAVQILVTAGGVMVLFLFIIMLLDISAAEHMPRQKIWMGLSLVLVLGLLYIVALTLNGTPRGFVTQNSVVATPTVLFETADIPNHAPVVLPPNLLPDGKPDLASNTITVDGQDYKLKAVNNDDIHQIGHKLFTTYVAPFEITSLLILVATIGVIVLCKQDERPRPSPREIISREAPPLSPKKETALTR